MSQTIAILRNKWENALGNDRDSRRALATPESVRSRRPEEIDSRREGLEAAFGCAWPIRAGDAGG